jgi:lysozyme family protein
MSIEQLIDGILLREGSEYTDRKSDKGGPTKYGITLGDWAVYTGKHATPADVQAITEPQAREFFKNRYIYEKGFDKISDPWLQDFIVDTGVLEGRETAIKMLQKILGVKADGIFGPITQAALESYEDVSFLKKTLIITRMHHLIACVLADFPKETIETTNLDNIHGWWNRVAAFI